MSRFTVDASVAIKWFVPEVGWENAILLLRHDLVAPDLLLPEVGNVLWKKRKRREISADEAIAILGALARSRLEIRPSTSHQLLDSAFRIADEAGISFYDSLYVSLAVLEGPPLVTADSKLLRKVGASRYSEHVLRVEDVRAP